jgi:SsrA-binding protein
MARDPATQRFAAQNRKARHDYLIEDTIEAGMMLTGSEVKSLRRGSASIAEAFAAENNGEFFLYNSYFPEYEAAKHFTHTPRRVRKLLLKKREINKLMGATQRAGITLVPLSIYFNDRGIAKVQLGLAKGKRKADKREADKERDWKREQARLMSRRSQD